jgi:catechol 2,3-dioxygenase-like lactoylglutathione lyase family enzyme
MKRMHLHVSVTDIDASVAFYSHLFAAEPTVHKADYAKWMLEDPRINFAISHGRAATGIEHLGIQVEEPAELTEIYDRLAAADRPVLEEGATTCCYAKSEKSWIADPDGIVWEAFLTMDAAAVYGDSPALDTLASANAAAGQCCTPSMPKERENV